MRLPKWFKVRMKHGNDLADVRIILRSHHLHTVCESAVCPNIWECWNKRTATFMILGDICTRNCGYCAVKTGSPDPPEINEPERVALAAKEMGLEYAVITSVDRDDLDDGGASIFAMTVAEIRRVSPETKVELLIPDLKGSFDALKVVAESRPDILGHNLETVPRLYRVIKPQASYEISIAIIKKAGVMGVTTKSGLILGMGEEMDEVREVMGHLIEAGCKILTLGQYLRPSKAHLPVARYYNPDDFLVLKEEGCLMGFEHVEAGPLVRSSYHAEEQYIRMGGKNE
ncbi:MAG: lipoyl synthase [Nitrospirae bacterium]|nr:lipoyl synthase [Nitrospirota bacterium]